MERDLSTTVTVRELAECIRRDDEKLANAVYRIQNWTEEGLLTPVGDRNPGTGKHRSYPEGALADALVLSILTEAVGMKAVSGPLGRMFKEITKVNLKSKIQKAAHAAPGETFLLFGLSRPEAALPEVGLCNAKNLAGFLAESFHETHVVIDLGKLNHDLVSKRKSDG
ncbi:hypothetical protein [Bradyrhizobium sp. 23]|uniref:hypothetical protein n=1 Tax=Bradyrhizobium sp. 23 TaxID=2782667 RepID=UPI001FFAA28C|nr:hypothetical protein [Bradyrhizobium sp. 23]MCK1317135.1 hypothetical protein [Bradyrhizobium sp. 23]